MFWTLGILLYSMSCQWRPTFHELVTGNINSVAFCLKNLPQCPCEQKPCYFVTYDLLNQMSKQQIGRMKCEVYCFGRCMSVTCCAFGPFHSFTNNKNGWSKSEIWHLQVFSFLRVKKANNIASMLLYILQHKFGCRLWVSLSILIRSLQVKFCHC